MVGVKEGQPFWLILLLGVLSVQQYSRTEATVTVNINELTTVGKTVKIVCIVTGERFVGWFDLKGAEVTARLIPGELPREKYYVDISGNHYTLVVQQVKVADGGNYACRGERESKISTLYVEFFVTEFPDDQDLYVGKSEVVKCSAEGYPKPSFVWYKDFRSIKFSDPRFTLLSNGSLLIDKVHELDSGAYTCLITQLQNIERTRQERRDITVTVYGPPRINLEKSSSSLHSYTGNPYAIQIKCKWWGYPVPSVGITKDGVSLPDEDVKKSEGFLEATVKTDDAGDFGTYVCDATNRLGSATHDIIMNKAGPPSAPGNITFTTTCDHLTVAWARPASDGGLPIKRYTIELRDAEQSIDTVFVSVGTTRFTFTNKEGVKPRTFYYISVQAANELNEGDKGEGNVTSAYCPPSGPFYITNNVTSLNTSSFTLTWTRPPRDGGDANLKYDVEYSRKNSDGKFVYWTSRKGIRDLAHNVSGLTGGSVYEFRVFVYNIAGRKREPTTKQFDVHRGEELVPTPGPVGPVGPIGQPDLVYDIAINCSSLFMQVDFALKSPLYLDVETFRFANESCGSHIATSTHVSLRTPLNSCGTTSKHRDDSVTYSNKVVARTKEDSKVYIVEFPFSCTYGKTEIIGVPSFQPRKKITFFEEGHGNFSFEMGLYRNAEYRSPYMVSEYPVAISPANKLYCEAKLATTDPELVLLADSCVATPTVDPFHRIKYTFIENGCPMDSETQYNYIISDTQRFQLTPFRWTENYTLVYLHCKVLVCHKGQDSRCRKGCLSSRRTRSAGIEEFHQVTLGPIMVREPHQYYTTVHEEPVPDSSRTSESSAPPVWWLLVVIICCSILGVGLILFGSAQLVKYLGARPLQGGCTPAERPSEEMELVSSQNV